MRRARGLGGFEQPEADALLALHERRIGARAADLDRLRHGSEIPVEHGLARPALRFGAGLGAPHEFLARRAAELLLQLEQAVGLAKRLALRIDEHQPRPQVRLELGRREVLGLELHAVHLGEARADRGQQLAAVRARAVGDRVRILGSRRAQAAQMHRQAADQRLDLRRQQAGHQPVEASGRQREQLRDRDLEAHAIGLVARIMRVAEFDARAAEIEMIREQARDIGIRAGLERIGLGHGQLALRAGLAAQPVAQGHGRADVGRQQRVVEIVELAFVGEQIRPAQARLLVAHRIEQREILLEEGRLVRHVAAHQGFANEDLPRLRGFVAAVVARAAQHLQAEQRDRLHGRDLAALGMPDRVLQHPLDQVRRDLGEPFRLDRGIHAREQLAGLRELRAHDPGRRLLGQCRGRKQLEAAAARAAVVRPGILVLQRLLADVVDQAREQALVDLGVELVERLLGLRLRRVVAADHVGDLPIDRLPFLHAQIGDEMFLAQLAQLAVRGGGTPLLVALPEIQQGEEVGLRMPPFGVLEPRGVLLIRRHFMRVLHGQRGREHPDRFAMRRAARGEGDACDTRVQRQAAKLAPERRDAALLVERAERLQQAVAVGDMALVRRIEPGKRIDLAEAERGHLQDHAGEVRAQDFRIGERRPRDELRFLVQAQADAGADTAAAAGALIRGRLRHGFDLQLLHAGARREAVDARRACVDDIADARHGHRGLSDVRGEHDARRVAARREHAVLLLGRQARIQRQHLGPREAAGQRARELVDLALARQEDQHVAGTVGLPERLDAVGDLRFEIVVLVALAVADLDRERAALNEQDRRRHAVAPREVARELVRIERRRGDDHFEFGPARQQALEPAEQEVDVEAALVRLVDDDRVVGQELAVALQLGQQDAVGHQLDQAALGDAAIEARLVADELAELGIQFRGNAVGHTARSQPARLRVADQPARAAPEFEAELGQLRRLAGAGLAADDDDLMIGDRLDQLLARLHDRQLAREADRLRPQARAVLGREQRLLHVALEARAVERRLVPRTGKLPRQPRGIAQQQLRADQLEGRGQGRGRIHGSGHRQAVVIINHGLRAPWRAGVMRDGPRGRDGPAGMWTALCAASQTKLPTMTRGPAVAV